MNAKRVPSPVIFTADLLQQVGRPRVRCRRIAEGKWEFNYSLVHLKLPQLSERLENWFAFLTGSFAPLKIKNFEITLDCDPRILTAGGNNDCGPDVNFENFSAACVNNLSRLALSRNSATVHVNVGRIINEVDLGTDWDLDLDPARGPVEQAFDEVFENLSTWKAGVESCWITLQWLR